MLEKLIFILIIIYINFIEHYKKLHELKFNNKYYFNISFSNYIKKKKKECHPILFNSKKKLNSTNYSSLVQ